MSANEPLNPMPALLTSVSIGRAVSLSRAEMRSTSARYGQVRGQDLGHDPVGGSQFGGQRLEPIGAAGDEHQVGAAGRELSGERLADPSRCSR